MVNKWRQKNVSCTTKGLEKVQVIQNEQTRERKKLKREMENNYISYLVSMENNYIMSQ